MSARGWRYTKEKWDNYQQIQSMTLISDTELRDEYRSQVEQGIKENEFLNKNQWIIHNRKPIGVVIALLGLLFIVLGIMEPVNLHDNDEKVKNYTLILATIDEVSSYRVGGKRTAMYSNNVTCHYSVEGVEYTGYVTGMDTGTSKAQVGGLIKLYYNPENPSQYVFKTNKRVFANSIVKMLFLVVIGIIAGVLGIKLATSVVTVEKVDPERMAKMNTEEVRNYFKSMNMENPYEKYVDPHDKIEFYQSPDESEFNNF